MTTSRAVRLVRVAGYQAAQRAMALLGSAHDTTSARDRAIVVPTSAAAAELRRTLDTLWLLDGWRPSDADCTALALDVTIPTLALATPDLVTRDDLYRRLHARLGATARLLSPVERDVRLRLASDAAIAGGAAPPFAVRPGLLAEMLALYDALRRRKRTVDDFERIVGNRLASSADTDRGARRLLDQTHYLTAAYREYERGLAALDVADEHRLRDALVTATLQRPYRHVVITVADEVGEAQGLWPADFDLLLRLDGLARIDVVATEQMLSAGLRDRLEELLPGIEECRPRDLGDEPPLLIAPPKAAERLFFLYRDRERELAEVARRTKLQWTGPLDEVAFVYQRPLPYLYLARQLLEAAGMPYDATDALPLAAEPPVASFDLAVACVLTGFSRASVVALLGAPHFGWGRDRRPLPQVDLAAFDEALAERGFTDGAAVLPNHIDDIGRASAPTDGRSGRLARVTTAVRELLDALAPLSGSAPASVHLQGLLGFLRGHEIGERASGPLAERLLRARAALRGVLEQLLRAHAEHGDRIGSFRDLVAIIRRWIEARTFAPRSGEEGVRLADATSARYGAFAAVHVLGLVEGEWPEPPGRSVLYPSGVLKDLNWPREQDRVNAARAAFLDLVRLGRRQVSLSAFTLEDDALVPASTLLEDLDRAGLAVARLDEEPRALVFASEAMSSRPGEQAAVTGEAARWLALRAGRGDLSGLAYHGHTGARGTETHAVTSVERYLGCPFKYFASKVLRLGEEAEDSPLLSPRLRGRFVHEVFQAFFSRWVEAGRTTVTAETLADAREAFERTVEDLLPTLPPHDRALERARLLGTAASSGMGDRVLQLEARADTPVVGRLLEYDLAGTYVLTGDEGPRDVAIRGIADRIDLLSDGTLRVVDYKTGRAPDPQHAVQLPIYAACAEQALAGHRGRHWQVSAAAYVAFGEPKGWVPVVADASERNAALADGQRRFVGAIDRIARGEFPPQPADRRMCRTCAFAAVCRKDVGDDD